MYNSASESVGLMSPSAGHSSVDTDHNDDEYQRQEREQEREQHQQNNVEVVALGSGTSFDERSIIPMPSQSPSQTPPQSDEEDDVVRRAREIALSASKILRHQENNSISGHPANNSSSVGDSGINHNVNNPNGINNHSNSSSAHDQLTQEQLEILCRPDPKQRQLIEEAAAAHAAANPNQQIPLVERIGKAKEKLEAFKVHFLPTTVNMAVVGIGTNTASANPTNQSATTAQDTWEVPSSKENTPQRNRTAGIGPTTTNDGGSKVSRSLPSSPGRTRQGRLHNRSRSPGWDDNGRHDRDISVSASVGGPVSCKEEELALPSLKLSSLLPSVPSPTAGGGSGRNTTTDVKPAAQQQVPPSRPTPTLSSTVWKKRSGIGKFSIHNSWSKRRLELVGSKLVYYKLDSCPASSSVTAASVTVDDASVQQPLPAVPGNSKSNSSSMASIATTASQHNQTQTALQTHPSSLQQQQLQQQHQQPHEQPIKPKKDLRQLWEQASAHLITKAQENLSKLDPTHTTTTTTHNHHHTTSDSNRGSLDLIQENATVSPLSDCHVPTDTPTPYSYTSSLTGSGANLPSAATGIVGSVGIAMPTMTSMMASVAPPTPFGLAVVVKAGSEIKWKICFESQREQMRWLAAITDVVVGRSVDCYNGGLLYGCVTASGGEQQQSLFASCDGISHDSACSSNDDGKAVLDKAAGAGGGAHSDTRDGKDTAIQPPASSKDDKEHLWKKDICMSNLFTKNNDTSEQVEGTTVPMPVDYGADESLGESVEIVVAQRTISEDEVDVTKEELDIVTVDNNGPCLSIGGRQLYYAYAVVNVSLCLGRASSTSPQMFWFLIVLINVVGLLFLEDGGFDQRRHAPADKMANSQARRSARRIPTAGTREAKSDSVVEGKRDPENTPKNGFKPIAGSSSIQVTDPSNIPLVNGRKFCAWKMIGNHEVKVRSHGYLTTKKKISTVKPLYRLVGVETLCSDRRIPHIASRVQLPTVSFDDGGAEKTWHSPDLFVISIAIPTETPTLGRPTDDGFGFTVTAYYVMTPETRKILRRVTARGYDPSTDVSEADTDVQSRLTNSVRLWEEWCRKAPTDRDFQARFKFIPNIHNTKEMGLPSYISRYCGKPVLIKRKGVTGFLSCHPKLNAMEFMISIHPFPYLVKKATAYMKDNVFDKALVSFSYVIEGRCDDELPEAVIGEGCMLCYPHPDDTIYSDDFFGGTAISSVESEGKKTNDDEVTSKGECP